MSGYADHFSVVDDAIAPQPWMQMREVASNSVPSVAKSYDPSDGQPKNSLLQTVPVEWTNYSPVSQIVYGLVTRGGQQVALQTRSRAYLLTSHGALVGPGTIVMTEVSKSGTGGDVGLGGLLTLNASFSIAEVRQNSQTVPLLPASDGQWVVAPGETIRARVEVRFKSDFWENSSINGGDSGTESKVVSGETLVQLIAIPSVITPPPRTVPSLVGGAGNVTWGRELNIVVDGTEVEVNKPAGLVNGDVLLAVACNQFGTLEDISPDEPGWTLAHKRNEGLFGAGDVHMKIYGRTIVGGEPATFTFNNPFPATEMIVVLIALRGAAAFDPAMNWYFASNLSRFRLVEEQVAPSLDRQGQFLLAVSYFNHSPTQASISQAPPAGMTELIDIPGLASTLAIAYLASPPFPSRDRRFTPTQTPIFFGHSIAASIVVPGAQAL